MRGERYRLQSADKTISRKESRVQEEFSVLDQEQESAVMTPTMDEVA